MNLRAQIEAGLLRWLEFRGIKAVAADWDHDDDQINGHTVLVTYTTSDGRYGATPTYQSFGSLIDEIDHLKLER